MSLQVPVLGTSSDVIDDFTLVVAAGVFGERVERRVLWSLDLTNVTQATLEIVWEAGPDSVQFLYELNGQVIFDSGWLQFGGSGTWTVDVTNLLAFGINSFKAILLSPVIRIVDRYVRYTVRLTRTWSGTEPPKPPKPSTDWSKLIMDNLPIIGVGLAGVLVATYAYRSVRKSG